MFKKVRKAVIPAAGLGTALVAGKKRVPKPAAGITALRTFLNITLPPHQ